MGQYGTFDVIKLKNGYYVKHRDNSTPRRYGPYNTAQIAEYARAAIESHGIAWADEMES